MWTAGWIFFSILKFWKICFIVWFFRVEWVWDFELKFGIRIELPQICFGENSQFFWTLVNSWVNFFLNIEILKKLFNWRIFEKLPYFYRKFTSLFSWNFVSWNCHNTGQFESFSESIFVVFFCFLCNFSFEFLFWWKKFSLRNVLRYRR